MESEKNVNKGGHSNKRQSIQEWTKQNLWKTAFKKFEEIYSA